MKSPSTFSPERFDQLRAENPDCGFTLYAMEPRGLVTLEILPPEVDGTPFQFVGATAFEAMNKAFPPEQDDEPLALLETPAGSVFD